jgi:hypothetical protein
MTDTITLDGDTVALASARARIALGSAPELVEHVLIHRIPGRGIPDGQPRPPMASRTAAVPVNVTALDDADELVTTLLDRAHRWRTTLGIVQRPLIRSLRYAYQVPLGFRPETTPAGARESVGHLTFWLLLHHDTIARHPDAFGYFDDMARLIERIASRFPADTRPPRAHWNRACPVCGRFAVTAAWEPDADVRDVRVWCEGCQKVLVSTSSDGDIRTSDHLPRTAASINPGELLPARKLVSVVRQIAAGTTVPRIEGDAA